MKYGLILWSVLFIQTTMATEAVDRECQSIEPVASTHFSELSQKAHELNKAMCDLLVTVDVNFSEVQQQTLLDEFAALARKEAARVEGVVNIDGFQKPFDQLNRLLSQGGLYSRELPSFSVDRNSESYLFYIGPLIHQASFSIDDNQSCQASFSATCSSVLEDYGNTFNQYKNAYKQLTAKRTLQQIKELSSDWDQYLKQSRSQTTLDLYMTTWMEQDHFKQGFLVGPPERQWSLLHPELVYEHLSDYQDGSQDKVGVAIEWLGVNWWDKASSPINIPFGISLASVYSDRNQTSDVGHGLIVHFNNSYSVGWSNRRGVNGFYFSVDLLKALMDKQETFNAYKNRIADL